jgi:hypothetical protein
MSTFEKKIAAGVREHAGELGIGVGAANRDWTVMARDAAAIDSAIQQREPVVHRAALQVVDDHGDARDTVRLRQIARYLRRLQMMQEETAGDDIHARIGERKIQSIARHHAGRGQLRRPGTRIRQMNCAAIEERDVGEDTKSEQRRLQHVCASTGDLQNVRLLLTRGAAERPVEQPCVQPDPAEALIHEGDEIERSVDLRRRAAVIVEPLVFNKSFHTRMAIGAMAIVTMAVVPMGPISYYYALPSDMPSGFLGGKAASASIALIHRWKIRSSENKRVTIL